MSDYTREQIEAMTAWSKEELLEYNKGTLADTVLDGFDVINQLQKKLDIAVDALTYIHILPRRADSIDLANERIEQVFQQLKE
jgi:hypothetical protein